MGRAGGAIKPHAARAAAGGRPWDATTRAACRPAAPLTAAHFLFRKKRRELASVWSSFSIANVFPLVEAPSTSMVLADVAD